MPRQPSDLPDSRARANSAYEESGQIGFCYLLVSKYLRTPAGVPIVKIGATRQHPLKRAKELSAGTGVPDDFELAFYLDFGSCFTAESLIHEHFSRQRVNEKREFFEVEPTEAIAFISSLANSAGYREQLASQGVTGGTITAPWTGASHWDVETPFAELFACFEDRGDGALNEEERAACRALEGRRLAR
jgi:hypothetical protein